MTTFSSFLDSASVKNITDDSRKVTPGSLFVAVKGLTSDGHEYIYKAIDSGAVAVVGERDMKLKVPYLKVENSRKALSLLASEFYDNPSEKMKMVGVTGTDGKTTTANLIYEILKTAGKKVGLISTVSAKVEDEELDTGFHVTNPEPVELQKFLSTMVEKGCGYCVLEVTSHGIDQQRIAGIEFEVSVLTNITHEHLDYHKTYENYLNTKAKLFQNSKKSILNRDDSSYSRVKELISSGEVMDYAYSELEGEVKNAVSERFGEDYNRENATAAISVARELGISDSLIIQSIKEFKGVIGRMEEIENEKGVRVIVDFAHTPNSLEKVLKSLDSSSGRLIVVFGCASERDNAKRPLMAKIATEIADISIFTAEDPRREDINKILSDMEQGVENASELKDESEYKTGSHYFVKIEERGEAISFAINKLARSGDTIVITGKGHEKSMSYDGVEYPWSDHEAVEKALQGGLLEIKR